MSFEARYNGGCLISEADTVQEMTIETAAIWLDLICIGVLQMCADNALLPWSYGIESDN